jgi:oligoribonuclease
MTNLDERRARERTTYPAVPLFAVTNPGAKYLWIDIETTGLDPDTNVILEIAAVVTGEDLIEIESWHRVFSWLPAPDDKWTAPEVLAMHTVNGLWAECERAPLQDGIDPLLEIIDRTTWAEGRPILAGSSVHFDRGFLVTEFEEIAARLHYRMHDVRTLTNAAIDAGRVPPEAEGSNHRAMADVRYALDRARWVRSILRGGQ